MNEPVACFPLAKAAIYVAPLAVWAMLAADAWHFRVAARPRNTFYRLLPWLASSFVAFYLLYLAIALLMPIRSDARPPAWFNLTDIALVLGVALARHMA